MTKENLRHWEALFRTDPTFTKPFVGPGGFRGTATSPTFLHLQLTEHFGPIGEGWGCGRPEWQIINAGEQGILIYCTVECWYKDTDGERRFLPGVGGDRAVKKDNRGTFPDDDAAKKAITDAIGNAFSRLGAGADIRLGLFNDVKYLAQTKEDFQQKNKPPTNPNPIKLT